jgi:hypothetical protein
VPDNRDRTLQFSAAAKDRWFPLFRRVRRRRSVAAMIYLIVGLDRDTLTPWRVNIRARDVATAKQIARSRACADGVDLAVAAVIGPDADVVDADPASA